jgi:exodeoxyribonuclease V beta subunit
MTAKPSLSPGQDWRSLTLWQGGRSLIEASAGTGKTWTISVLYLRLLLEQKLSPRQIVVTTFTNAAAEELRERLRGRLLWAEKHALSGFAAAVADDHSDACWLSARWQEDAALRPLDLQRIRVALAELDMAPITTLHGLCQRILADYPFAAGALFKGGELVNGGELVADIAKDLLRRLNQGDPDTDPLIRLWHEAGIALKPAALAGNLKLLLMPGSRVHCLDAHEVGRLLSKDWSAKLRQLSGFFRGGSALVKRWAELADFIDDPAAGVKDPKKLAAGLRLAPQLIGVSKERAGDAGLQAAVEFSVRFANSGVLENNVKQFWSAVSDWAHAQATARLASLNQRSFDGLLSAVHDALHAKEGRLLADALFSAWPVALVDEFQDTDGVQFGILDAIYRNAEVGPRGRLVMIGDPKQAIYRFRGGDIQAYANAVADVDDDGRITLDVNRRSSRAYVAAVNELYQVAGNGLSAESGKSDIEYVPVHACDRHDHAPYRIDGQACEQPLFIHYRRESDASSGERRGRALEVCANQIQEMLASGRHAIGPEPLRPSDIAVLLPANHHVDALRALLRERGVPCVTTTRASVFSTQTARELQVILYAVANCSALGPARAAVATRLWNMDYAGLRELGDDPVRWQDIVRKLHGWRQVWLKRGVQAVVDQLIDAVAVDQLASTAGERCLTDLRHLGELLQERADASGGIEELLSWFTDQRHAGTSDSEEAADSSQLRIESDAKRVRLMTLHASKGLEFPVVFLPLMWAHGERNGAGLYQRYCPEDGTRRIEVSEQAKDEEKHALQDERFRILYVALTRAIHACHVLALPADRPARQGGSPASGTARTALDVMLARLSPPLGESALANATPHIHWVDGWRPLQPMPCASRGDEPATVRQARALPDRPMGVLPAKHSFTTLTQHSTAYAPDAGASADDEEEQGSDSLVVAESEGSVPLPATLPAGQPHADLLELEAVKGKDFGNAAHAIFENRQPLLGIAQQADLVNRHLAEYNVRCSNGKDQKWLSGRLINRLQAVLDTPLGADQGAGPRLADMGAGDMRAEMAFHFVLDGASMGELRRVCLENGEPGLIPAQNRVLAGFMNGKIDLVFRHGGRFHVLDYKGNYLGNRIDDYQGEALRARMDASDYRFQALLYSVALDRYLRQRMGGNYVRSVHLGDCYYLFIRAVGLAENAGIWRHRFSDKLLEAVQAVLGASKSEEATA